MAGKLEANEITRRQLMADISHELRTPLAVLSSQLENLEDGVYPLTQENLLPLREEVTTLTKRINDIRQLSLAEVGALQYQWRRVDLSSWLDEVRHRWWNRLAEEGIALETQSAAGLVVHADRDRLHQLLQNLIDNARCHANDASSLRILVLGEAGQAVIECHDDGPGVDERSLPRLFERFWREDRSRSRGTGGSGLGLAICRSIAIAHAGRIEALRSAMGGLCIRVSLPLAEVES
nr:ATP-binding protein [Propionivibrio limicola]